MPEGKRSPPRVLLNYLCKPPDDQHLSALCFAKSGPSVCFLCNLLQIVGAFMRQFSSLSSTLSRFALCTGLVAAVGINVHAKETAPAKLQPRR